MKNKISWLALLLFVGYVAADFYTAPMTPAGAVKAFIGSKVVEREVRLQGAANAKSVCDAAVFETMGFYYTCTVAERYNEVSAFIEVSTFLDPESAREARGRMFYKVGERADRYHPGEYLRTYHQPLRRTHFVINR